MTERLLFVALLLLVGACAYLYLQNTEPPAVEEPAKEVRFGRLPDNWAVADLNGKEVTVRELRGKVVFLNRWATWCGPCVAEMPSIQALHESLRGSDIIFVILTDEEPGVVKSFVDKKQWSLPIYLAVEGLPPVLRTNGIPATFIINPRGEVVFRQLGGKDWNTDEVRALLKKVS